jgi:hypothetical protein
MVRWTIAFAFGEMLLTVADFHPWVKLTAARAYSAAGHIPSGPDVDFQPRLD